MKPAGGIRTAKSALHYLVMVKETLGDAWLQPHLFRFGAKTRHPAHENPVIRPSAMHSMQRVRRWTLAQIGPSVERAGRTPCMIDRQRNGFPKI
jgi:hypothetical protein